MQPLRILHVTPYFTEAWAYGGIPRLAHSLARGLARRGHQVTVCTTDARDAAARLDAPACARTSDGVEVRTFANLSNRLAYHLQLFLPLGLHTYLQRHAAGFDVAAERAQIAALGVPSSAVRVIPNPIDLDEFASPVARGAFRARIGRPSGPLVVFLGKLTPRKRLDVLVRAFSRLRRSDATLVIAGNDMGGGAAAQSLVRTLGLESRTIFTGLLRGRERLEALADADVVVYPSEHEIFGLVALESLLSGTPVIVADDSGCGEIVRAVGGGEVVPLGDVDALARAIDGVLDDPCRWRAAATAAAPRIRASYGDDVVCAQTEALYAEMVKSA